MAGQYQAEVDVDRGPQRVMGEGMFHDVRNNWQLRERKLRHPRERAHHGECCLEQHQQLKSMGGLRENEGGLRTKSVEILTFFSSKLFTSQWQAFFSLFFSRL